MKIHHIGYAVRDIGTSAAEFEKLGYRKCSEVTEDTGRNVCIQFMEKDGYMIELVAPLNDTSHLCTILKKAGSSPYHFCYMVENIGSEIDNLLNNGYILVEKPCMAPAVGNGKVAFLYHKDIGILELLEGETK